MASICDDRMAMEIRLRTVKPALVTLIVTAAYVAWRLSTAGWDPVALAELGTRFSHGDPSGTEGYDGQFVYYIAVDPDPKSVSEHLDVPVYRFQRILLPYLSRLLSLGEESTIPWMIIAINMVAHTLGTWAIGSFLRQSGLSEWYALIYGLWVGLVVSAGTDLHEPLAYGLVAIGWLARQRDKHVLGAILLGLALFAKETTLLFWLAILLADILRRENRTSIFFLMVGGLFFAGWQIWLWGEFGAPGLGSGGAMATSFEWIPFMGLWRIGYYSLPLLFFYIVAFGPTVVIPTIWSVIESLRAVREDWTQAEVWILLLNASAVVFLPFSTFREKLGLLRFTTGLVLALLLFSAVRNLRKPLNYALMWIPLLAILISQ